MLGSSTLEVAIGVMFVYLLLSLICTSLNESIATFFNKRGKNLFEGIKNLLNDPSFTGLAQQVFSHGLVDGISKGAATPNKPNRLPSYMASNTFALAILDILRARGVTALEQERLEVLASTAQQAYDAANVLASNAPNDQTLAANLASERNKLSEASLALNEAKSASDQVRSANIPVAGQTVTRWTRFVAAFNAWRGRLSTVKLLPEQLAKGLDASRTLDIGADTPLVTIGKAVQGLPDGHTKESLLVLIDKTKRDVALAANAGGTAAAEMDKLRENIEAWYNQAMDRVGGWYKRWTQIVSLFLAAGLVIVINADTVALTKRLARDNTLRASVVAAADKAMQKDVANETTRTELLKQAGSLNLPLGWVRDPGDPYGSEQVPDEVLGWLVKGMGLAISILAISLGAPFWFDTLSKFVNIRGAGTPPGETKKSVAQPKTT